MARISSPAIPNDFSKMELIRTFAILGVAVTVETTQYLDLEKLAQALFAVD